MDKINLDILKQLQQNGRASAQQLTEHVGLSAAPIWRRIKALEHDGVIQGYHARVDRSKVGLHSCMFTQVSLDRQSSDVVDHFIEAVQQAPEVVECHAVTGDADFLLKVVVAGPEAYDAFLHRFLADLQGVRQTRTIVGLREIKNSVQLPL